MKIAIRAFGGMLPIRDTRLLPEQSAEEAVNTWLYGGNIEGLRVPRELHTLVNPSARMVYRIPQGSPLAVAAEHSWWLEFPNPNTTIVRSPNTDVDDPRYYWADGVSPPGYTTQSRVEAGLPPLVLGIPTPSNAPTVVANDGSGDILVTRSYVYTWESEYLEEGPPSPPSAPLAGRVDDTWVVTLTPPTASERENRSLKKTRIYRTVSGLQGQTVYYFVDEVSIDATTFSDTLGDDVIVNNEPIESTFFTPPPADLEGLVSMPNGMIAGWRGKQLWFCEPFHPHAWPAIYQTSVDYDIVGMATYDQMLVIGTENVAYVAGGVHPSAVSSRIVTGSEPCVSQGSFVVSPQGAIYAGPNGLMLVNSGGCRNVTKDFISTAQWTKLLNLSLLHAALLNGAYYCFSGVYDDVFQRSAFQNDAFQLAANLDQRTGALIELNDARVAVSRLVDELPTYQVIQDPWSAEILLVRGGKVWMLSMSRDVQEEYSWQSKVFQLPMPDNLAAMKIIYSPPLGVPATGTVAVSAGGQVRLTRSVPQSGKVFRLLSGFKSDNWQFTVTGTINIEQIEIASSVKEIQQV